MTEASQLKLENTIERIAGSILLNKSLNPPPSKNLNPLTPGLLAALHSYRLLMFCDRYHVVTTNQSKLGLTHLLGWRSGTRTYVHARRLRFEMVENQKIFLFIEMK